MFTDVADVFEHAAATLACKDLRTYLAVQASRLRTHPGPSDLQEYLEGACEMLRSMGKLEGGRRQRSNILRLND